MKHLLYGLLLVVLLVWSIRREGFTTSPSTLLEDVKNKKVLVLFYMPGCPHCDALKPKEGNGPWDKAEAKMGDKMVAVDVSDSSNADVKTLTEKFNIKGYPTMLVLDNGNQVASYDGERTEEALVSYVQSM